MTDTDDPIRHINLAIPESLLRKVRICAKRDNRSVTQQIITALKWMTREVESNEPTEHV